jgi:hypothetical protein
MNSECRLCKESGASFVACRCAGKAHAYCLEEARSKSTDCVERCETCGFQYITQKRTGHALFVCWHYVVLATEWLLVLGFLVFTFLCFFAVLSCFGHNNMSTNAYFAGAMVLFTLAFVIFFGADRLDWIQEARSLVQRTKTTAVQMSTRRALIEKQAMDVSDAEAPLRALLLPHFPEKHNIDTVLSYVYG